MRIMLFQIIAILVFFTLLYVKPAQADSADGIEIQNIKTLPAAVIIGHTFKINATLVNNSTSQIFVEHGSCEAPFSATFDSRVLVRMNNITCTTDMILQRLDPGEKITATSPYLDVTYVAAEAGTTNATVTFRYSIWDQNNQSSVEEKISAPFSFEINPITKAPTLTPSDNNELVDIATSIPGMQAWSHDWQFVTMGFMTAKNQPGNWQYAIVNLKAPSDSASFPCTDDWWARVMIDRSTMKVVDATYPTMEDHGCGGMIFGAGPQSSAEVLDNATKTEPPLKQFKSGIAARNIQCNAGLALIIKSDDSSPRCVGPETASILIQRGWASEFVLPANTDLNTPCDGIPVASRDSRTNEIPVLLMQPNSTAKICVEYYFDSDWNSYPNKEIYPYGILETCCFISNAKYSTEPSSRVTVMADPPLFNVTRVHSGTKIAVRYTIHTGSNSTGFYDNSVPYGSCMSYPMAIGYAASQVDKSHFSKWIAVIPPCFYSIDGVDSVKIISGMNYTMVNFS